MAWMDPAVTTNRPVGFLGGSHRAEPSETFPLKNSENSLYQTVSNLYQTCIKPYQTVSTIQQRAQPLAALVKL